MKLRRYALSGVLDWADMTDGRSGYLPTHASHHRERTGCPLVTVSYAQSLDGCLTLRRGEPSPVSGRESTQITHELRAAHDAILVGIGTVLADDPRLTVRGVNGRDPQPVVVDSHLRFPAGGKLQAHPRGVWVATTGAADDTLHKVIEEGGGRVSILPPDDVGRVNLGALLNHLGESGIDSVMVEGGGTVISSFLREGLADRAVITIAPVFAAGYHAVQSLDVAQWRDLPRLSQPTVLQAGDDMVVWGDVV